MGTLSLAFLVLLAKELKGKSSLKRSLSLVRPANCEQTSPMPIGCRCQAMPLKCRLTQWGRGWGGCEAGRAASAHVVLTKLSSVMETLHTWVPALLPDWLGQPLDENSSDLLDKAVTGVP